MGAPFQLTPKGAGAGEEAIAAKVVEGVADLRKIPKDPSCNGVDLVLGFMAVKRPR